jgi:hypothetical protein
MLLWSGLRMVASRFVAGRRDEPGGSRGKWLEVWSRRDEWLAGYEAPKQAAP